MISRDKIFKAIFTGTILIMLVVLVLAGAGSTQASPVSRKMGLNRIHQLW